MGHSQLKQHILLKLIVGILFKCDYAKGKVHLDMFASEKALRFSEIWLNNTAIHISMMLPTKTSFQLKNVVKMSKKMTDISGRPFYFMFRRNFTKYTPVQHYSPSELLWFPLETPDYDLSCNVFHAFKSNKIWQNHFLVFFESRSDANFYFQNCKIRFDSNVVAYYWKNESDSLPQIAFEEIYKIDENQQKLTKNTLGTIELNSKKINITGLNSYIWERRQILEGVKFKCVVERLAPYITSTIPNKSGRGNNFVYSTGFFADIISQLMHTLNFTISSSLPQKRNNWTYLIDVVGTGMYDIGCTGFMLTKSRNDFVDFSFGIKPYWFELYYVKQSNDVRFDAFLRSFHSETWYSLAIYASTLILGFVVAAFIVGTRIRRSAFKETFIVFQKATNFVLRTVIGKRIGSEPNWCSTRIAFIVLILSGFLIITHYRAILVAFVTIEIDQPPVISLDEIPISNHRLAVYKNTGMDEIFRNAAPGSVEYKIKEGKKILHFVGVHDFIDKMVNGEHVASNTILFYHNQVPPYSEHYPCKLSNIKSYQQNNKQTMGMVFKKNWPFTKLVNYHLLKMKEIGTLDRLYEPYLKTTRKSCPHEQLIRHIISKPKPVGTNTTFTLYLVVFSGILCAFICMFIEILYKKYD